jgi:hypothetical protein
VRLATIGLTVWLMQRYPFFRRSPGDPLRFFAYVLNGLIAAAAAAGIALLFHLGNPDPLADLPLILLSFMLCTTLALCCDDWVAETMPPIWWRLGEAAGCAATMAFGLALVVMYLAEALPFSTDQLIGTKLAVFFAFPSAMAFVIGACVPHIYRSARRAATARRNEATQLMTPAVPNERRCATEGSSITRDDDDLGEAATQHQLRGEVARRQIERVTVAKLADRIRTKRPKLAPALTASLDLRDHHHEATTVEQLIVKRDGDRGNGDPVEQQKKKQMQGFATAN